MNHLIDRLDMGRIESSLLQRKTELIQQTAWMFNLVLLGLVLSGFAYFLKVQYESTQAAAEFEEKRIPFTPTVWYSATRNVRSEEYGGQPFETETRYGLS